MCNYGPKIREEIFWEELTLPVEYRLPVSYEVWKARAQEVLPSNVINYLVGAAGAGETDRADRKAFNHWRIVPRTLVDISHRDLTVSLFGHTYPAPIFLAPIGRQGIYHTAGELAPARAAARIGVPYILSSVSTRSIEEVAAIMGSAPRWFQLYWGKDPDVVASFLHRARSAGYSAIVVTLDNTIAGWRERDLLNATYEVLFPYGIANYLTDPVFLAKYAPDRNLQRAVQKVHRIWKSLSLTWDDLDFLRRQTDLPILLKGLVHPGDAKRALQKGVDGIIVSNHAGRHLDGGIATLDALPRICEVVGGRVPVLMDSGIQRGADVVKAISLGASAVLVGRLYIYALAVAGERGVLRAVQSLIGDTDITMGNAGRTSVAGLDRSLLTRRRSSS